MSKGKIIMITILGLLLLFILVIVCNGLIEYSKINKEIKEFKSKGVLVYSDTENKIDYYEIASDEQTRTFDYRFVYDDDKENDYFGDVGDITITNRNPLRELPLSELINPIIKLLNIGHATMNVEGNKVLESEGKEEGKVRVIDNQWLTYSDCPMIIGLKVKTDRATIDKVVERGLERIGDKYNWLFVLSFKNKAYCTELIHQIYKPENIKLNYDGFITTGNDLIYNKHTYIYYYQEKVEENGVIKTKVYYLS